MPKKRPLASLLTFAAIFALRLAISLLLLSTADVPDEWWQSTEVAYNFVHGRGEMTWEWRHGIRSYVYPLPFIIIFGTLRHLGLDNALTYWAAPKIVTAVVAFLIDYHTAALAAKWFGRSVGRSALLLSVLHGFTAFISTRTQSNVAEALVLVVTLQQTTTLRFFLFAAIGCALRTTFALPVLPAAISLALVARRNGTLRSFIWTVVYMVCAAVCVIAGIDSAFYGSFVITPLRFLTFNVLQGSSALFGTHPWHWYFTAGLPSLLGGHVILVPFACSVLNSIMRGHHGSSGSAGGSSSLAALRPRLIQVLQVLVVTLVGYSLLGHKEFRFIYPLMPLLIILLAIGWTYYPFSSKPRRLLLLAVIILNASFFLLFGMLFQRGTMDVASYLRRHGDGQESVHVLTGCHQMPGYSYMHGAIGELVTINCSILINSSSDGSGSPPRVNQENHLFIHYPLEFVDFMYDGIPAADPKVDSALKGLTASSSGGPPRVRKLPGRIVAYTSYVERMAPFLKRHGYVQERAYYHTSVPVADDIGRTIEIWRKKKK